MARLKQAVATGAALNALLAAMAPWCLHAEITTDGSLPGSVAGPIDPVNNEYRITEDRGRVAAPYLFHSFETFNLATGEVGNFTGSSNIQNILARVTGDSHSWIDGTIRSEYAGANLFFLNPNGITFGPSARLDVQGSFHASTAHRLYAEGKDLFSYAMKDPADDLITAAPEDFGFLGESGSIEINGSVLGVSSAQVLSFVGGDISINGGTLVPTGGKALNIVSAGGPGEASLREGIIALGQDQARGDITITNSFIGGLPVPGDGAHINIIGRDVSTSNSFITSNSLTMPGRGIRIDAETLTLDSSFVFSQSFGVEKSGSVLIDVKKDGLLRQGSLISTEGTYAGDIEITAHNLALMSSFLRSSSGSTSTQSAGDISMQASGSVELSDVSFLLAEGAQSAGGRISIEAEDLTIEGGSGITTASFSGDAGSIVLTVGNSISLDGDRTLVTSRADGAGDAGSIAIRARTLTVTDGARITGETLGSGRGAEITIDVTERLTVEGIGSSGTSSAITTETSATPDNGGKTGNAGRIMIKAGRFVLQDEGTVSASTATTGAGGDIRIESADIRLTSGGKISTASTSKDLDKTANPNAGRAGTVTIDGRGGMVMLSGQSTSITSETTGEGDAGDVVITRGGDLTIRDGAEISASVGENGSGKGGTIKISATNIELLNGGKILARSDSSNPDATSGDIVVEADDSFRIFDNSAVSVETAEATAGDIDINVQNLLHLRDNSRISTSAGGGDGDGGDITIDPIFVILENGSQIVANAKEGSGGNITIVTDFLFQSLDSDIDASSEKGIDGTVVITSPETDVVSGTLSLPESFLDAAALLGHRCGARTNPTASSFVISGRQGIPPGPDDMLPSDFSDVLQTPVAGAGDNIESVELAVTSVTELKHLPMASLTIACGDKRETERPY